MTTTNGHHQRQDRIDTRRVLCFYAHDPIRRPDCTLTADVRYAKLPLCASCAQRRSTVGKGQAAVPLPTSPPLDLLNWVTDAHQATQTADQHLTAAVTRARSHGHSWTQIANHLGVTRQAAQQRFRQHQKPGG